MTVNYDVIPMLCVVVAVLAIVQGATVYAVVKLLVTGRAFVERRTEESERRGLAGHPWSA